VFVGHAWCPKPRSIEDPLAADTPFLGYIRRSMKYVIGSGWWASTRDDAAQRKRLGDDVIRSARFHDLWYASLCRFTSPAKIFIVDSSSPIKPGPCATDDRLEIVSLDENYGHAVDCDEKLCGWSRSVLLGLAYALACSADYFVYVEQDCLLFGEGIVEHAIAKMRHPYMFGSGAGTPQPLQQSFFIVHHSEFARMIRRLERFPESDRLVSPEVKFARLKWDWLPSSLLVGKRRKKWLRRTGRFWYDELPFGCGRTRPIDWEAPFFYFQHGSADELSTYMERAAIELDLG